MLQVKLGVELASLRMPLKKGLLTARDLGAEAVEIDLRGELSAEDLTRTGVRHVRKMLDDLNLRVSAVAFRTRRGYATLQDLEPRIEATKRALATAYELGTNAVVNSIGSIPPDGDAAAMSTLLDALAELGRYGQKVGAFLAAETGANSGEQLATLIERLPASAIGIDFNPAKLILEGHSPRAAVEALAPHVLHVHATDATRDLSVGRGIEVPLGQGNADFPELLGVLEEQQYRGYITVARHETDHPLTDVRQSLMFLRNL
jgi:sugar phosphate isomerase/epimerase